MNEEPKAYSLTLLKRHLTELDKDIKAFNEAFLRINQRSSEAGETGWQFNRWYGTYAVLGSLEMGLDNMRRTREEIERLIRRVESGELENLDKKTPLRLV